MADFEVRIDLGEVSAYADVLAQAPGLLALDIDLAMLKSLAMLEEAIVGRTPVGGSGNLSASFDREMHGEPLNVLTGEVASPLIYAPVVEYGRRPGSRMPPPAALELWLGRVADVPADEVESIAFVIARAIGRRGTKGVHMMRDGFSAVEPAIERLWQAMPGKLLEYLRGG